MRTLYVFHHVFKTGGTSFNLSYAPSAFAEGETFILRGSDEDNREDRRRAIDFTPAERAGLRLIAGHNTGELRPFYPHARYLSLVREPVNRSISAYLHAKHHPDSWSLTGREIHENNMSLATFMEANWFNKNRNFQTRLLLDPEFMMNVPRTDGEIAAAIRSRFHLVGYTEAFELFLFYLHLSEGFPLVLFNKRLVRKERAAFQPTTEDLRAIRRYSQLDHALYLCARAEFDRKLAAIWTDRIERLYSEYSSALETYRRETAEDPNATPLRWSVRTSALELTAAS